MLSVLRPTVFKFNKAYFKSLPLNSLASRTIFNKMSTLDSRIDNSEFKRLFTPEFEQLRDIFTRNGYELRVAGGAVRDILTGKVPHDVDFATTATPKDMTDMFNKENIRLINSNGEKHGTITCRINNEENFEITTLRVDLKTDGRHAEVEFTKDWVKDAGRRDLTINSMFLGLDGTLYDYFNGEQDLKEKKVRFVGMPSERIKEDYLRILRYFRFYGRISQEPRDHDPDTLMAIRENADGLSGISGERIWVEVKKLTMGNHVDEIFRVMNELGVLPKLGFSGNLDFDALSEVWRRCRDMQPMPMTIISSMFLSQDQVEALHGRVKMSKDELLTGSFIVEHRDDVAFDVVSQSKAASSTQESLEGSSNARGESRECKKLKIERSDETSKREGEVARRDDDAHFAHCQDMLIESKGDMKKVRTMILELLKYLNLRETHGRLESWEMPRFPVSGMRLKERGYLSDKVFGREMNRLKDIWKKSRFTCTEEELLQHLKVSEQSKNKS